MMGGGIKGQGTRVQTGKMDVLRVVKDVWTLPLYRPGLVAIVTIFGFVLPDLIATPPTPSIHGHQVGDGVAPRVLMPPDYSPYYPDPTWRELETLRERTIKNKSKGRNASYGF